MGIARTSLVELYGDATVVIIDLDKTTSELNGLYATFARTKIRMEAADQVGNSRGGGDVRAMMQLSRG